MAHAVDALVARFHSDRRSVSRQNRFDVALVFVTPRFGDLLRRASVLATFRHTDPSSVFAPFDRLAAVDASDCVCYILHSGATQDFEPLFCRRGDATLTVQHYRIEFEALLRTLSERGYRYLMKPVHATRAIDACVQRDTPVFYPQRPPTDESFSRNQSSASNVSSGEHYKRRPLTDPLFYATTATAVADSGASGASARFKSTAARATPIRQRSSIPLSTSYLLRTPFRTPVGDGSSLRYCTIDPIRAREHYSAPLQLANQNVFQQ